MKKDNDATTAGQQAAAQPTPKDVKAASRRTVKETSETKASKPQKVRYIKQPWTLSAMQADLSKQQIKILVGMMQSIQDGVQEMFERQKRTNGQLLLFPELESDHVNIDFRFSDVVDRPDYYENVERVAQKFVEMVFRYEDKEMGEVTLSHFVDEVTYPSRGSKRDKIRFSFTKKQAEKVFNFTMYSKYMLSVAFEADSKYTARLYMLITSARGYSTADGGTFHWYVSYQELRRMLGCDVKEGNVWVQRSRKQYKHFKADILRVAEKELKELADAGKCDCWFEFVELPVDEEGKPKWKGQPKTLDFVVHLSEMGLLEAQRAQEASRFHAVRQRLTAEWGLSEHECGSLLSRVPEHRVDELERRLQALADWMDSHRDSIDDPRRYVRKSVGEIVRDIEQAERMAAELAASPSLFPGTLAEDTTSPQHGKSPQNLQNNPKTLPTPEAILDRWFRVLSPKDFQMYVRGLERHMQVMPEGRILVAVDHEEVKAKLEGWRPLLERAVDMRLDIQLRG